ncbi:MAG: FISUMP domain-containing protein [Bacteroidales bacterium]
MKTKSLYNVTKYFLSTVVLYVAFLLFTSCDTHNLEVNMGGGTASGATLLVTVSMPEADPQTRISHEQDGLTVRIAWQSGDKIDLLVVHGGEETVYREVSVTVDETNNKKATFPLTLPDGTYETFDLYGVYGGGGLDSENPRLVKLPTVAQSTSSSLKEIEKNKAVVLVFSQTGISRDIPDLKIGFKHIGSLFNIQVKNTSETDTLDKVTEARLTASSTIPAYSNSGAETYDITTGAFSGTQTTFLTCLPVSSSNVVPEGILEFWAWIPLNLGGNAEASWPALGLEIVSNGTSIATPGTKPARTATVGKTYHLYATHDGSALTFATAAEMTVAPGKLADFRDGNLYKIVTIGSQTWMAQNLAYLPSVNKSNVSYEDLYYYVYDNAGKEGTENVAEAKNLGNYIAYGVLYNWLAAFTACPDGWHLPSATEWEQLKNYLIVNSFNYDGSTTGNKIAKSLASESGWDSSTVEGSPGNSSDDYSEYKNKSGFTGLPGGFRGAGNNFNNKGQEGNWWSSTLSSKSSSYYWYLKHSEIEFNNSFRAQNSGCSVRCVKD